MATSESNRFSGNRPSENQSNDCETEPDPRIRRKWGPIPHIPDRRDENFQKFFNRCRENPRPITIPIPTIIPREIESMDQESINGPEETHKLSITIMDWSRVSAKDLLLFLNPFLSEGGRILSVAVYPGDDVVEGYHAVAICDSSATADYLYKSRLGIESEFERCSNKLLDFKFIPDSMEFIQLPRDVATQEDPAPDPTISALVQGVRLTQLNQL
ncbi:ESF1 homolog isoform X2 [Eutrema salsugineum]|uniref:ESF1 homolog isoform X2 n=1 Tax=Eutrema salsugineum TaxID=72664 RepID=UPI000CED3CA2|nr:ESF1 homolog isoform X2 [Eutrema salsugineum]